MDDRRDAAPAVALAPPPGVTESLNGRRMMSAPATNSVAVAHDSERAVAMARTLTDVVQDLVRQLEAQEERSRELQKQLRDLEENARSYETARDSMRSLMPDSVSRDDLLTLQRVLQSLAQDPNHIMVLAAVAQQAGKLLTVVNTYGRIFDSVR